MFARGTSWEEGVFNDTVVYLVHARFEQLLQWDRTYKINTDTFAGVCVLLISDAFCITNRLYCYIPFSLVLLYPLVTRPRLLPRPSSDIPLSVYVSFLPL
jgi:hypothetical protein